MAKSLHADLAEVMAEVAYVQFDKTNKFNDYKYASAAAILQRVNASLSSRGICVGSQSELLFHQPPIKGSQKGHAAVQITLTFTRGTESVSVQGLGEGSDAGDKSIMKANTAAIKYAVASGFMISWDKDPEHTSPEKESDKPIRKAASKSEERRTKIQKGAAAIDLAMLQRVTTVAELEALKPDISALGQTNGINDPLYVQLRDAWKNKQEEITSNGKTTR